MDRGTWQATVHGVAESDTTEQLTHASHTLYYIFLALPSGMRDLNSPTRD